MMVPVFNALVQRELLQNCEIWPQKTRTHLFVARNWEAWKVYFFNRFAVTHECDGRTDRQTDRQTF